VYIQQDIVKSSFERLKSTVQSGKSHLEKTSCLMYFLAFDALVKKTKTEIIEIKPNSFSRKDLSLEYAKLVLLGSDNNGSSQQVLELGLVETAGKDPEKRISSNFYTVPLKKASEKTSATKFPNRPAPILLLGKINATIKWGITYHPLWETNFPKFISEIVGNTPFTDLSIFVCRNDPISEEIGDWFEALSALLNNRFTDKLSVYLVNKIKEEKRWVKHIKNEVFFSKILSFPDYTVGSSRNTILRGMTKTQLIERVVYLEKLLDKHSIPHNKGILKG
jgi:hypothetical protein